MKRMQVKMLLFAQFISFFAYCRLGEPVKQLESIKDGVGRMYLFTLGNNGAVYYVRQSQPGSQWDKNYAISMTQDNKVGDSYKNLPVLSFKQITSNLTPEGTVVIYGLDNKGVVYANYQRGSESDAWSGWYSIGNDFIQILGWKDKSQSIVGLKTNGSAAFNYMVVNSYREAEGSRNWKGWKNLDGWNLKQLACEETPSGYKVVFALSNDGSVYHNWGKTDNWNSWTPLEGTELKKIEVARMKDGRLSLFAIGGDNAIYERHQITPEGSWTAWTGMGGGNFKDMAACISNAGRITLFGLHSDKAVDHIWQNEPGSEAWSSWSSLGGDVEQSIKCMSRADGRMTVFVTGGDGNVYYRWQAIPDGYWEDWRDLSYSEIKEGDKIASNNSGLTIDVNDNSSKKEINPGKKNITYETNTNNSQLNKNDENVNTVNANDLHRQNELKAKKKNFREGQDNNNQGSAVLVPVNGVNSEENKSIKGISTNNEATQKIDAQALKPYNGPDSLQRKISELEERVLNLENKTPYAGMDIIEITANSSNLTGPYPDMLGAIILDHPLLNNNPHAVIFANLSELGQDEQRLIYPVYQNGKWELIIKGLILKPNPYIIARTDYGNGRVSAEFQYLLGDDKFTDPIKDRNRLHYYIYNDCAATLRLSFISPGEKIKLLIFAKSPTLKQEAGGRLIKLNN